MTLVTAIVLGKTNRVDYPTDSRLTTKATKIIGRSRSERISEQDRSSGVERGEFDGRRKRLRDAACPAHYGWFVSVRLRCSV